MLELYSHWGFPNLFTYRGDKKILLCIDPPNYFFNGNLQINRNKFDIIVLVHGCEPPLLNNIEKDIILHHKYFDKIFSFSQNVVTNCNNAQEFVFGSCWALTDVNKNKCEFEKDYVNHIVKDDKKYKVSFIRSGKKQLPGHKFRYEIEDVLHKNYDFNFYIPNSIPFKYPLFEDAMFHIAIENTKTINYFTEKIIDCFMTYTIPIYWGCPNILDYFDKDGIITFETKEELSTILSNLTPNDYNKRQNAMKNNYEIAKNNYAFIYDRISKLINNL